jgi:hypothetical protein
MESAQSMAAGRKLRIRRRDRDKAMLASSNLSPAANEVYDELLRQYTRHSGFVDSFMYNGGTLIALLASGAAGVIATVHPFVASCLSALAAFFIAATRILNFGGRWRWHLQRQSRYASMIYRLNAAAVPSDERLRDPLLHTYEAMSSERRHDGMLPGSGEPADTDSSGEKDHPADR